MKPPGGQNTIPEGWCRVRLGDVAEVNPRRRRLSVDDDTPVTFLPMAAIAESSQGILTRELRPYDEVSTGYTYFEEDDFLFSKITPCLQNGKHTLATGLRGGFGFGTTEFHVVRASPNLAAPFMFRALTQAHVIDRCAKSFTGTAGQQRIQPETLKDLPILLPPLPEQRAIAAVLDSIDDAIEGAGAVIAATEQLRNSLLHQLLTRGVPGWHTEWKDVPGLGTIPADWEVVRLGEVASAITSGSRAWSEFFRREGALFVRSQNIIDGRIDRSDAVWVDPPPQGEAERTNINEGDLLISITGEPGKTTVADSSLGRAFVSQHVALVRLRDQQLSEFAGRFLQGREGREQFRRMVYGQTRPGLNLSNISATKIAVPPAPERQSMTGLLNGMDVAIAEAKEEWAGLQLLKKSAADALLTGRVRVGACNA